MNFHDEFAEHIRRLVSMPCWSVQIAGVGSLATLHFGGRVPRAIPLVQPSFNLTPEERAYQGEIALYLEDCPWRLENQAAVLATWMDSSEHGGRILSALPQVRDRLVTNATLVQPGLDLVIAFDGGLVLRIFPDQVDPEQGDNYSIVTPGKTFVVAANSTLYIE